MDLEYIWIPNTNVYIRAMYPGLEKRRYEWKVLLKSMNNSVFLESIALIIAVIDS